MPSYCTWIHNSFSQSPLLTYPAWVSKACLLLLAFGNTPQLERSLTRGGIRTLGSDRAKQGTTRRPHEQSFLIKVGGAFPTPGAVVSR